MAHRKISRLGLIALWCALGGGLVGASTAKACRCEQRTLAEYFAAADEVFIAQLTSTTIDGDRSILTFDSDTSRLKASKKPQLPFASYRSSATCGVEIELGATYVVFAEHDVASRVAWLSSCNGSRVHLPNEGEARGFEDVPARFVASQLNGLAGLDILRRVSEHEPRPDDPTNERLVGLLDIPSLAQGGQVALRSKPIDTAEVIATVSSMEDLDHRENGYEIDAAVVFAVVDGWYKLRLADGTFAWQSTSSATATPTAAAPTAAAPTAVYSPMDELPIRRLTYLNEHWDGWVWPGMGAGLPNRRPAYDATTTSRAQFPVHILESSRIGSSLWFRVELLKASPCDGGESTVVLSGWIPAYGASGEPAVWFYSRGC